MYKSKPEQKLCCCAWCVDAPWRNVITQIHCNHSIFAIYWVVSKLSLGNILTSPSLPMRFLKFFGFPYQYICLVAIFTGCWWFNSAWKWQRHFMMIMISSCLPIPSDHFVSKHNPFCEISNLSTDSRDRNILLPYRMNNAVISSPHAPLIHKNDTYSLGWLESLMCSPNHCTCSPLDH